MVHSHLNSIVNLRNRIAHNEPICFDAKGAICLKTIKDYELNILDALGWIDNDLKEWAQQLNRFPGIYRNISLLYESIGIPSN